MNQQQAPAEWTDADEAAYQAMLDDEEAAYEEGVQRSYEARGQGNLY